MCLQARFAAAAAALWPRRGRKTGPTRPPTPGRGTVPRHWRAPARRIKRVCRRKTGPTRPPTPGHGTVPWPRGAAGLVKRASALATPTGAVRSLATPTGAVRSTCARGGGRSTVRSTCARGGGRGGTRGACCGCGGWLISRPVGWGRVGKVQAGGHSARGWGACGRSAAPGESVSVRREERRRRIYWLLTRNDTR